MTMAKRKSVVTMAELQKAANVKSRQAISAWVDAGLLPAPTMERGPSGRGRRGVWPASVLDRVRFIRAKTAEGLTLEQVLGELWSQDQPQAEEVAKRVDAVMGRWVARGTSRRRAAIYEYRKGSKRGKPALPKGTPIQHEWSTAIYLMLSKDAGLSQEQALGVSLLASDRAMIERALELYFLGFEPVLVLSRGCLWIASSATMGIEHSNVAQANLRPPKEAKDRPFGRVTLELHTLILTCLVMSGDARDDDPIRMLVPPAVVDEVDLRHPYIMRRRIAAFFQKVPADISGEHEGGYIDAKLTSDGVPSAFPASFDSALSSLDSELDLKKSRAGAARKRSAKRKPAAGRKKKTEG